MRFCFFRNTLQRYFENHKKKKHTFHLVYKDAFHIHQNYVHTFTYRFSWKANCKKVYNNYFGCEKRHLYKNIHVQIKIIVLRALFDLQIYTYIYIYVNNNANMLKTM